MITEQDLKEAIAECQGARNPNANTCIKLAAFLTIQKELYGTEEMPERSFTYDIKPDAPYESDTEFGKIVSRKDQRAVWAVIDELMTTLEVINPRLYNSVIDELS